MQTGAGTEYIAVEALKAGVDDYIIKDPGQGYLELLSIVLPEVVQKRADRLARKQAEEALRESQRFIQRIADTSPNILYVYDIIEQKNIYVNKQIATVLGYSLEKVRERDTTFFQNLIHADDFIYVSEQHKQWFVTARDGDIIETEYRMKHANGEWRWFHSRHSVFTRTADGLPQQIIGVAQDITARKRAEEALQQANQQLKAWVSELEQRNHEITLLNKMGDLLQTCLSTEEAYTVIALSAQQLFPNESGALYMFSNSKSLVEMVAVWGKPLLGEQVFASDECWALRRGQIHSVQDTRTGLLCGHINQKSKSTSPLILTGTSSPFLSYMCVPMMAQGETLGMLYLQSGFREDNQSDRIPENWGESKQRLIVTMAEHIGLALANLKLRETLRNQSIRDPLTGLFNRRYMEEALEKELRRASRNQKPLGVIMLDLDHFKRFNDNFGHDAGDFLLRNLGTFLQAHIRGEDIACRYGGEEFTLILPGASPDITQQRAEYLREGVKHLNIVYRDQFLGLITLSLGIAIFPDHGTTVDNILRAADLALYRAKTEGRDRVVTGPT
jgi:diguanylate cyclase (GGDEF)-like protein/PAS domain S-box-containing protein